MSGLALLLVVSSGLAWLLHGYRARRLADARLAHMLEPATGIEHVAPPQRSVRYFPHRYRSVAPAAGAAAGALAWLGAGVPLEVSAAIGALIGIIAHLIEEHRSGEQAALIESQLASAIYLMVSSLRAGASLLAAFESALDEIGAPLRPYFQEVAGRIRLGDDPRTAVSDLQVYIPLETFRLFATSLAVHWEVGGSLATTLSTVGQTVRDRIELSRRVRAQSVESHASVAVVLVMAYVLGFLMWRTNPDRLEAFIRSGVGTGIIASVIALQAVGLIWMSRLNRSTF